jgi:hypothetical protein
MAVVSPISTTHRINNHSSTANTYPFLFLFFESGSHYVVQVLPETQNPPASAYRVLLELLEYTNPYDHRGSFFKEARAS